ncbi:type II toxin-antitoxin system VapC family toxin [Nostoc sp.]|uniref:type II toxin-antitoxin system VapC family toxin n=1 Tax=Nostoc sp. TaxID=1180 RepID=UPI003592FAF7
MVAVVADTHAIVWYLRESAKLSEAAIAAFDGAISAGDPVYVSAISLVEVAYLAEKYRLPKAAFEQLIEALSNPGTGLAIAPLDITIAQTLSHIPRDIVPDMPDRIIAATALYLHLPLVTRDLRIQALTIIQTIW